MSTDVKVRIFRKRNSDVTVEGRLLGLVTPELYNGIIKTNNVGRRLFNSPSIQMDSVLSCATGIEGYRLAITVKRVDDEVINGKKILFTEPLDYISEIQRNSKNLFIQTISENTIHVKEL